MLLVAVAAHPMPMEKKAMYASMAPTCAMSRRVVGGDQQQRRTQDGYRAEAEGGLMVP